MLALPLITYGGRDSIRRTAVSGGFDYASESGFYAGFGVPTLISTMVMVKNLITMLVMRLMSATQ